jgi:DNA polymerase elongation subunit (family B)
MLPVIFDIETGPVSDSRLREILPPFNTESVPHPGEFDPSKVKTGNMKDEKKISEKIEAERKKHTEAVDNYERDVEQAEAKYWQEASSKAALSALTCEVLAIGYKGEKKLLDCVGEEGDESKILSRFWAQYRNLRKANRRMVGYNIAFFDIPTLVQRSWILGITVPDTIFTMPGRYLEPTFIDLAQVWQGSARNGMPKLDTIAKAFGIPGKPDGISGGDFARLFHNPETRQIAIDYLSGDLDMTFEIAQRIGIA